MIEAGAVAGAVPRRSPWRQWALPVLCHGFVAWLLTVSSTPSGWAAEPERERRCLALVAYAEAAGEGAGGMAAVIRVMRNRMGDPRFPGSACAVALQDGQFQPVGERPALRAALVATDIVDLTAALGGAGAVDPQRLGQAVALAAQPAAADPTAGALYFVNPAFMDRGRCPWFAGLKRTAAIGGHVFMTHREAADADLAPALDCRLTGLGRRGAVAAPPPPPLPGLRPPPPALSLPRRLTQASLSAEPSRAAVDRAVLGRADARRNDRVSGRVTR